MNRYLVLVTGPKDSIGLHFMQNVVELANKGATLVEDKVPCLRMPHAVWMYLQTEELMEDKPGFKFQIIEEQYTKEQLDEMEWEDFKRALKKVGIGGRSRDTMTTKYLKKMAQEGSSESKEEDKE